MVEAAIPQLHLVCLMPHVSGRAFVRVCVCVSEQQDYRSTKNYSNAIRKDDKHAYWPDG